MKKRMGDIPWSFTEKQIAELYPELDPEERAAAADNLSAYFRSVGKLYDHLEDEGKLDDALLRAQYDKRDRNKPASQNAEDEESNQNEQINDSGEQ